MQNFWNGARNGDVNYHVMVKIALHLYTVDKVVMPYKMSIIVSLVLCITSFTSKHVINNGSLL